MGGACPSKRHCHGLPLSSVRRPEIDASSSDDYDRVRKNYRNTKKATGRGIISLNEPSTLMGRGVAPLISENCCHFCGCIMALGCKKTSFPVLEERRGVCYFPLGW